MGYDPQGESSKCAESGSVEEDDGEKVLKELEGHGESSMPVVHETHPVTGEPLEEGEFVHDLTNDQLKTLFMMNEVD
ncbi:hypothetical protein Hanom_Chr05g00461411 [Helianthus anomalus]